MTAPGSPAWPLPAAAAPEAAGFSARGLERLHRALDATVDDGSHAGYVLLLARGGRLVDWRAHGWRDAVARTPLQRDDLFRIFSMTKIVTAVAVLALLEEGRLRLDDPVERFLPELAGRKVLSGATAATPWLVDAVRPPTLHDLLTHTAGYSYPDDAPAPLLPLWRQAAVLAASDLDEFVARVAQLPLAEQPGTAFRYGIGTDLLGAVVQRASGKSFEAFLAERITGPLGMVDTGFWISEAQRGRLALIHRRGPGGRLELERDINAERPGPGRGFRGGGGGLFSTAPDFARFAQALLQGGELEGVRILSKKTVELMTCDHLGGLADPHPFQRPWLGYGLCVRVTGDLGRSPTLGSPGAFGWDGLTTTNVEIAPREGLVGIVLYQHLPWNEGDVFATFLNGTYAALE